ncbi:MAG: HAD family hydrolase [Kiritimatiellia bacterium]
MHTIKLIVTDLDGTLVGNDNEYTYSLKLAELIATYRERYGALWVICSGRSRGTVADAIEDLREMGLEPDYVIVRSSFVYASHRYGIKPMVGWNWGVRTHILMNFMYLRSTLRDWHREINRTFKNVLCLNQHRNRLCLRFRNRHDADAGAEILRQKARDLRHLRVYQYLSEVDVRSVTYTKGMAVEELAGHLEVKPSETLCIGNGTSDISMLDGVVGAYTGCPANAEVDVIDQVHQTGGYIAAGHSMEGVVEILQGYLDGNIKSTLPAWWSPSHTPKQPRVGHGRHHRPHRKPIQANQRTALQIGLLAAYTVLVVFANFNLVPFSHYIMMPFRMVAGLVERIMRLFM